jgi:hypothetical protein
MRILANKEGEIITFYYQYHWMYYERREIITFYYQYQWMISERRGDNYILLSVSLNSDTDNRM